ncbi:class I SAM-dependent methyltransferase [Streptomyces sp. NBC_00683]|uniref:class I SAM-dependent methyltransferase n=1 Tax=Streptomyces sp. NBC_00683 TaxID=2903670 RepID=UPI002E336892|nr:class I SAM-dependent methyltransferase [Streptomyces sp. NBC_00683]
MNVSEGHREAWEGFWAAASGAPGEALWDADPSLASVPHSKLLLPYADASLPVVDLGCGNGTQTRALATLFPRAIGVDLSHAAIGHARRADTEGVAEFARLDLVDGEAVRALHERIGDTNVYMRAVIHQSEPGARPAVAAAVAELVGEKGRAFVTEPTPAAKDVIRRAAAGPGGPPPKLRRPLDPRLKPASATAEEVPELLRAAGLTVLADGDTALAQTEYLPDGTRIELPARWLVLAGAPRAA